jgi:hypothetical protein
LRAALITSAFTSRFTGPGFDILRFSLTTAISGSV